MLGEGGVYSLSMIDSANKSCFVLDENRWISFLQHKQISHIKAIINIVLMYSGIVIGYQLWCYDHTILCLNYKGELQLFYILLTIVLFHYLFCVSVTLKSPISSFIRWLDSCFQSNEDNSLVIP